MRLIDRMEKFKIHTIQRDLGLAELVATAAARSDDETTRLTRGAHEWSDRRAAEVLGDSGYVAETLGASRFYLYETEDGELVVADVRGQSLATGHGKTGAHPSSLVSLATWGVPALVVYVNDGTGPFGRVDYEWLHRCPRPTAIVNDPRRPRQGWFGRDLTTTNRGEFRFPTRVPPIPARRPRSYREVEVEAGLFDGEIDDALGGYDPSALPAAPPFWVPDQKRLAETFGIALRQEFPADYARYRQAYEDLQLQLDLDDPRVPA